MMCQELHGNKKYSEFSFQHNNTQHIYIYIHCILYIYTLKVQVDDFLNVVVPKRPLFWGFISSTGIMGVVSYGNNRIP